MPRVRLKAVTVTEIIAAAVEHHGVDPSEYAGIRSKAAG